MKKLTTSIIAVLLVVAMVFSLVACGGDKDDENDVLQYDGTEVQGIDATNKKIYVGNTTATSGGFASVGIPFNYGLKAALWEYNQAGGFDIGGVKYEVELKTYDDEFTAEKGATYTTKLTEDDKVFALVGHFGTNTVGATVDYIKEAGIPMVYAATGIASLYQEKAEGYNKAVMPVQPIYNTEGKFFVAYAMGQLSATKVGVISTTDDAGKGFLYGIEAQVDALNVRDKFVFQTAAAASSTDYSAAVNALKTAGCDVVIIAANQTPFVEIMNTMKSVNYDNVKVITSYVSANGTTMGGLVYNDAITATRQVFCPSWINIASATNFFKPAATDAAYPLYQAYLGLAYVLDGNTVGTVSGLYGTYGVNGFSASYWEVASVLYNYGLATADTTAFAMSYNSYALAGYIAGTQFCEGLKRVAEADKELTWKNFIDEMEDGKMNLPMNVEIDYSNGIRYGVTKLAFNTVETDKAQLTTAENGGIVTHSATLVLVKDISSIEELLPQD